MSVEKVTRAGGEVVWRVRWGQHGRNRARTFSRRRDARDFDAEVRRQRWAGSLAALDAGAETLGEYVIGTWAMSHAATVAAKTQLHYASLYDYHLRPYLASIALREITPEVIGRWQADRLAAGGGPIAVRHAMDLLDSILEHAFVGGHLSANPARRVKKAKAPRREEVQALSPGTIERMRPGLDARDATLISVLAHAGLRPVKRSVFGGETSASKPCSSSARFRSAWSRTRSPASTARGDCSRRSLRIWGCGVWPPAVPATPSWCSPARKVSPGRRLLTSRGAGGRPIGRRRRRVWRTLVHMTCATASLRSSCTKGAASSTWLASSVTMRD